AKDDVCLNSIFFDNVVSLLCPFNDGGRIELHHSRLVHESVHCNDIIVPRLSKEFGEAVVHLESLIAVKGSIGSIEPVHGSETTRMIPAIGSARHTVNIKFDAKSIFTSPFNGAQEIPPRSALDKGISWLFLNCPVSERKADVVEASIAN